MLPTLQLILKTHFVMKQASKYDKPHSRFFSSTAFVSETKPAEDKRMTFKEQMKLKKKESKKNKHRARLVIHNLPYATTEEQLREHFGKYGDIDEVTLLKREDGKLTGCGFVQFSLVQKAAKARHHLNGKPFLNRNIKCDWAVPKKKHDKSNTDLPVPVDEIKIEKEDEGTDDVTVKVEKQDDCEAKNESIDIEERKHSDDENSQQEDSEEEEQESFKAERTDANDVKKKPFIESNDAAEGKTIFIKNLPFTVTNEELKECMSKFGPLYYALVCIDRLTEHSKGTGFVKFRVSRTRIHLDYMCPV